MYSRELWIEYDDAKDISEGEKITLMKWGNANVTKKVTEGNKITIWANIDEEDKDFKKTKKITWLCADPANTVEIKLFEYAHLIDKQKIEETDDVEKLVNKKSK
jgi:tRNA synthetases class I (E and Q), anti-codon binding domain